MVAEELDKNVIELEGESLIVVPLAFTDTAGTTCLHAPSLELIAAGDGAYNDVHPRLVESNQNQKRGEWLSALDKMAALHPRNVVAGHKNMKNDDDGVRVIAPRLANTSWISRKSPEKPRRQKNCTTGCWFDTRNGSTGELFGVQQPQQRSEAALYIRFFLGLSGRFEGRPGDQ